MPEAIPQSVKPVLDAYISAVQKVLPDFMAAFYLHGSIALGDFQPRFSDVDFITVINRQSTVNDLAALKAIHQDLKQKYPQCVLSGSYLQWQDLGQYEDTIAPHPYYQDGMLHTAGYHDINFVTWWILKNHGLALVGPEPQRLNFTFDWNTFIHDTHENMNTYWVRFTREPRRMSWLLSDGGIQWAIPGVLRQYYTFRERSITSKTAACEYALAHLPERRHRMIQEALNIRTQNSASSYRLRLLRAVEAVRFLKFVIHHCNTHLDTG